MRPRSLKPDSRICAISVPNTRPPSAASPVKVSVNVIPSRKRYPIERRMTSKSRLENMAALFPRDVAGDRQASLQETHARDDDGIDQEIKYGRSRKRLEHLKGKFLHRARLAGEFDQADGDRDRGVLDGVEEFGRQRRQDNAKRDRQQHIAIALRRGQAERGRGL